MLLGSLDLEHLVHQREVASEVAAKKLCGPAPHLCCNMPWQQHDDLNDAAGACHRRFALPTAREFEEDDITVHFIVASARVLPYRRA